MELFRKFFGFSPPQNYPSNNEYYSSNEDDGHYFFEQGNFFSPGSHDSSDDPAENGFPNMMDSMQQMEQMMHMMEQLMTGAEIFSRDMPAIVPSQPGQQTPATPRDQLLKSPGGDDSCEPALESGVHGGGLVPLVPRQEGSMDGFGETFSLLQPFAGLFGALQPFGRPSHRLQDPPDTSVPPSPREQLIRREDGDLDNSAQTGSDLSSLLKDGPGYDKPTNNTRDGSAPGLSLPSITGTFTSTSISRIVKPDGSVEERRVYRDHTGKEEVTVTNIDPHNGGPSNGPPILGGGPTDPFNFGNDGLGSILGGFFR